MQREQSCKSQLFQVTNKEKHPRMFSLAYKLSKTALNFGPSKFCQEK